MTPATITRRHRETVERKAVEHPPLDEKARKRLLDAHADGVSWAGLRERFGLTQDQLERELREGR